VVRRVAGGRSDQHSDQRKPTRSKHRP
jgi:hypothetical protein